MENKTPTPKAWDATRVLIAQNEHEFRKGFANWFSENWHIYQAFEAEAMHLVNIGRRHYSARTIGEYLRHQTTHRETTGHFKMNDHVIPDMARLFALRNPQHAGLFEFRGSPTRPRPSHALGYSNMDNGVAA